MRRINIKDTGRMIVLVPVLLCFLLIFFIYNMYFYITGHDITDSEPYPVKGIDVSSYQLDIDWEGLEDESIRFAFIKATEGGTLIDPYFEQNWHDAHRSDIRAGAYHFMNFDTDPEEQADNFISTVKKKRGMLPPVLDVEFYGDYEDYHPDRESVRRMISVILERFEQKYDMVPVIYTNHCIYKEYISGCFDRYPVWISTPDVQQIPSLLPDGREWTFCQYTFTGRCESIGGGSRDVDFNVFNGDSWDFRQYRGK